MIGLRLRVAAHTAPPLSRSANTTGETQKQNRVLFAAGALLSPCANLRFKMYRTHRERIHLGAPHQRWAGNSLIKMRCFYFIGVPFAYSFFAFSFKWDIFSLEVCFATRNLPFCKHNIFCNYRTYGWTIHFKSLLLGGGVELKWAFIFVFKFLFSVNWPEQLEISNDRQKLIFFNYFQANLMAM